MGFVAGVTGFCGQRWLLGLVAGDDGGGFQYGMNLQLGVVLGFDVVVSFLCVGGFGYCWSRFDWVLVWVVKLCCGSCCS